MAKNHQSVYIKPAIAKMYIVLGVIFVLIFVLGSIILNDFTNMLYAISSTFLIVIGAVALKSPYADFGDKQLIIYNFLGKIRIKYTFDDKNEVKVKNHKLYYQDEKMKISKSFVNPEEWNRLVNFYSEEANILDELKD